MEKSETNLVAKGGRSFIHEVARKANFQEIRRLMKEYEITAIKAEYSGGGDSGSYEGCEFTGKLLANCKEALATHFEARHHQADSFTCTSRLTTFSDLVECFMWDEVSQSHCGFENNEGGRGELFLSMEDDANVLQCTLNHVDYVVSESNTDSESATVFSDVFA